MIHKVNRPPVLSLVSHPKRTQNDPGASSGSGLFYDGPSNPDTPPEKQQPQAQTPPPENKAELSTVTSVEKAGMTEAVVQIYSEKHETPTVNQVGLTTKYTVDNAPAKGMLLNRKI